MRTASVKRATTIRFDTDESPELINGGDGWTESAAQRWLQRHDVVATVKQDGDYFRARVGTGKRFVDMREVDVGVMVIQCEN